MLSILAAGASTIIIINTNSHENSTGDEEMKETIYFKNILITTLATFITIYESYNAMDCLKKLYYENNINNNTTVSDPNVVLVMIDTSRGVSPAA